MSRRRRLRYSPENFVDSDGKYIVGPRNGDISRKRVRQFARRQVTRVYGGESTDTCNKRVRRHLTHSFRANPTAFFSPIDHETLIYDSREQWLVPDEHVTALTVNLQFKLFRRVNDKRKSRKNAHDRDAYNQQLERCKAPTEEEILSASDKNVTFYFEYVYDTNVRLRQLGGRQHNKARTHIDCVVEVYNYETGRPLTTGMRAELARAKRTTKGAGSASDRQLLGTISHVVNSILAGERKFMLVVYDLLRGPVGATCAPQTHAYLQRNEEAFERDYLQLKSAHRCLFLLRLMPTKRSGCLLLIESRRAARFVTDSGEMDSGAFRCVTQCSFTTRLMFFMQRRTKRKLNRWLISPMCSMSGSAWRKN